jgi:ABC-type nitrate/sulfonate/bicarbonate transport system substrate-binding protein
MHNIRSIGPAFVGLAIVLSACGSASTAPASSAAAPASSSAASASPAAAASAKPAASAAAPAKPAASAAASAKPAASGAAAAKPAASASGAAAAAPSGSLPKVRIGWTSPSAIYTATWIANDAGYYQKYGIDGQLTYIEGDAKGTTVLVTNDMDIAMNSGTGTIDADIKGAADLVMALGMGDHTAQQVLSTPKLSQPSDLKGKTIAIRQGSPSAQQNLVQALAKFNMTLKDMNVAYLGDYGAMIAALQANQIDAALMTTDSAGIAVKNGDKVLIDVESMHIPTANTPANTRRSFLAQHRPEFTAFAKAEADGIHRLKTDKAYAEQVMSKYLKQDDKQLLDISYDYAVKLTRDDLLLSPEIVQAVIEQAGYTGHQASEFMDMSVPQELNDNGFIKSLANSK